MSETAEDDLLAGIRGLPDGTALLASLSAAGARYRERPLRAATPTFRHHEVEGLAPCRVSRRFPSFSITGPACALGCAHCRARVLEPMIPATDPATLDRLVRAGIAEEGLTGFLLSGGSNRRNEVPFERYMPVVRQLKSDHPSLEIAVHTGLVDRRRAGLLADAGIDVAMIDIIGDDRTIREVYNLDRPVEDFAASLDALVAAGLRAVPHIVVGLHFGRLLGEDRALRIIAGAAVETVILVVAMPVFAVPGSFATPDPAAVAGFFMRARAALPDHVLLLGCARPFGAERRILDAAAVLAGFDGIAYPGAEALALARRLGRVPAQSMACCGLARRCRAEAA